MVDSSVSKTVSTAISVSLKSQPISLYPTTSNIPFWALLTVIIVSAVTTVSAGPDKMFHS